MIIYKRNLVLLFCILLSITGICADNLRQINSRNGLSNSSVNCLFQDDKRFLWIGTFDGLNMYDGKNINIYKPDINNLYSLSSNVIRNIIETDKNNLWISTKWGLNKLSKKDNIIVEYHDQFKEDSHFCKDNNDNLYILGKPGALSLYDNKTKSFIDLPVNKSIVCKDVAGLFFDTNNMLWINHKGIFERYTVSFEDNNNPVITRHSDYFHAYPIIFSAFNEGKLLWVDSKGNLYSLDSQETIYIRNIQQILKENGEISSIIYDYDDILISFKTNGVVRFRSKDDYKEEWLDINCGVFSMLKDRTQDVIWIGTDGQGIYAITKDNYTFNNIALAKLPLKKQRPVRAIYTDHEDNLWMGTKDNGLIRINKYGDKKEYTANDIVHYTTDNGLCNNAVFALTYSPRQNVLWIGSDGEGLNYYSYSDKKIHKLMNNTSEKIENVHSVLESKDSTLWIGAGNLFLKVVLDKQSDRFRVNNLRHIPFKLKNDLSYNQIYALHQENDSIIWIGIRGNGLIRFNSKTENYQLITFENKGLAPMNDILCIHQDNNLVLWLGTSYGLTRFSILPDGSYTYKNYNENNGLPNNTIHGILGAPDDKLWLSSNTGLILFDPITESFRNFNQRSGLDCIEFSDNAYFKDDKTAICFFGGVDGIVSIKKEQVEKKKFTPDIYFTKIRLFNESYMIGDFQKKDDEGEYVELKSNQNFFAVSFVSVDFINGENSRYIYRLKNFSDEWMKTDVNEAQFTNLTAGEYILEVKYNEGTGKDDYVQSIRIIILPPWYLSAYAKIFYLIIVIGIVYYIYSYFDKKNRRRKRKINYQLQQKYKEKMYEEKLRFFTNITHELSTPLTLIHGPCERILTHNNTDSFVRKYAEIIKSNTERLNSLIQEIIDFRRIETGNNIFNIEQINVSKLSLEIAESFMELAERNNLFFETNISPDILWNTDSAGYTKIVSNLISNAFKYTPTKGRICMSLQNIADNLLELRVYNTGKGIKEEDIPLVFNRYSVLNNVEENSIKGLSARNGLGLAICDNIVKLLKGNIRIESEVNQYAEFIVTLPLANIEKDNDKDVGLNPPEMKEVFDKADFYNDKGIKKESILVIDDNKELLWLLKDIFSDEYYVHTAESGQHGLEILKKESPDVIITDVMMPGLDGITLTKYIKENKHTMHIPVIILSAKNTNEDKIEGFDSGADVYVSKPFNAQYLKKILQQQIKSKRNLQEYYNSSASAFAYSKGQLLIKEDKAFIEDAVNIINNNLYNSDFSTEDLADNMQIGVRNLYRKLKELNQPTPNDLIRDVRIKHAARLLVTTSFTIQEVMYKSGFHNRSHFYREFSRSFEKTPKEYRDNFKTKDASL